MRKHTKKFIAPIIICILILVYAIFWATILVAMPMLGIFKAISLIIPLGIAGLIIWALVSRIKEIKGGEEDDISKY